MRSIGTSASTRQSLAHISMRRTRVIATRTQGALSNYKNLPCGQAEPAGHGIGRPRGGWTMKIYHVVDRSGRPLAVVVTGGQSNDGAMLEQVLGDIRAPRRGGGRPRNRPDAVLADKANSGGVIRRALRARGISAVIPEKSDQIAASNRRGCRGGRPLTGYRRLKRPQSSNAHSHSRSNGVASPPDTTKWPSPTAPPPYSAPASPGPSNRRQALVASPVSTLRGQGQTGPDS